MSCGVAESSLHGAMAKSNMRCSFAWHRKGRWKVVGWRLIGDPARVALPAGRIRRLVCAGGGEEERPRHGEGIRGPRPRHVLRRPGREAGRARVRTAFLFSSRRPCSDEPLAPTPLNMSNFASSAVHLIASTPTALAAVCTALSKANSPAIACPFLRMVVACLRLPLEGFATFVCPGGLQRFWLAIRRSCFKLRAASSIASRSQLAEHDLFRGLGLFASGVACLQ